MKISVTQDTAKKRTIVVNDPTDDPKSLCKALFTLQSPYRSAKSVALKALMEQHPTFDIATALTSTSWVIDAFEYVVRCVQTESYALLDFIFDNGYVSVDYIASNGSPLVLFALQCSLQMFTYFVTRGAQLIRNGDLIANERTPSITAIYAAGKNDDIRHVLMNMVLVNIINITSIKTLHECSEVAKAMGVLKGIRVRFTNRIDAIIRQRAEDIEHSGQARIDAIMSKTAAYTADDLNVLVSVRCTRHKYFSVVGKDLPKGVIIAAMCSALSQNTSATYYTMCLAFPDIRIRY